jgi:predicted transcriptional regulator of viral defense system
LRKIENRLFDVVSEHDAWTADEIAELAGVPLNTVRQFLSEWVETGFMVAISDEGIVKYRVSHPGDAAPETVDPEAAYIWLDEVGALTDEFRTSDQIAKRGEMQPNVVRHLLNLWEPDGYLRTLRRNKKLYWATGGAWA